MRQLFISYARENKPDVEALVRDLDALGYQTWLDSSLRGGQSWWQEILRRIADSDVFVAIVSGHTLRSVACKRELEWALAVNKPVLPIAVERLPDALPRNLSMRQIVDYSQSGREAAFALAGALGTLPPAPPPPEQLPEPPAAPLSYLSDLVEQVGQSEALTQQQQHQILIQLEPALRSVDTEERRGGRYVLEMFRRRGDLYADVDRTLSQIDLADHDPESGSSLVVADIPKEQSSASPQGPAERRGNPLADPQWADALSAFFANRWAEAVDRFEALQASYPAEPRIETRLKEACRQRDIDIWSEKAEAAAAAGDWDNVVTALENLAAIDPTHPEIGARLERARLAQRRKAVVDEMKALHQAGRWDAVTAAARELAQIDPDNADPGGIVCDARAQLRGAELSDRYAQALNHLDQEHWQQAADLLTTIDQEQPGYRDAAALLTTTHQRLLDTTTVPHRTTPSLQEPTSLVSAPTTTRPSPPTVQERPRFKRRLAVIVGAVVVLLVGLIVLAVSQSSTSSNMSTSTSTSTTTSVPPTPVRASGPNESIFDYLQENSIQATTVTRGAPGAPAINLPVPDGWKAIPDGPDASYGGIVFNTPSNPNDPPKIMASVQKLTGKVDADKLLAVTPGALKNLPGYAGGDGQTSTEGGYPAYQVGGPITAAGDTRYVAQKTVVIQGADDVYLLQLKAEAPQADAGVLAAATDLVDQKITIKP
ncbi:LpqN/LpqT family lipoprotein [Mycobacterium sp. OTB74]|jgi:tetratricopeptide (TPR) repeat protein|uniref:LpqN/LpqT family lipoprotein n=1 Tax=Mycobacterium sp. OTB74 TaxID=1853452 RepID=UPI002474E9A4|nr:LpqN/LpqT family lipoprotein [Mycobacterium sp. OTB74]MDH6247511.1 tetratricopeptide (TPR) repeat protein [Mycobacterium sp. OTB74]